MIRVLHLIDGASRAACPTTLALLATTTRSVPADHRVLLLGGANLARDAASAGLAGQRVGVPGQHAVLGFAAARRALAGESFDAVHAWSIGAAILANLLFPRVPRVLSLVQPVHPDARPWLRRLAHRGLRVLAIDGPLRDELVAHGVPAAQAHIVPPAVDPSRFAADRDPRRAAWGLPAGDARVIALLGDPPAAADARLACLSLGLAYESLTAALRRRPPLRLIVRPDQHGRTSAWRMLHNYGVGDIVSQEPRVAAPWAVLPACDAVLLLGRSGGGLALRWAMAAGLPIVAERLPSTESVVADERTALLAEPDQPKRLAHRLHQLIADPRLAANLGASARAAAAQLPSPADYGETVAQHYAASCSPTATAA